MGVYGTVMEAPDIRLFRGDQFIQISVRHARTHLDDGKAQFTDYEIELKTNHIAFTLKYSKVRRRYSDFVWLRNRLMKDTMTSDPITLPGRRLFGRFNKDFIKQRQKKLQEFLFSLVQNNVYLSHAALHLFLQSKLTADEIDSYLDSNMEEDATETILAESEGKARLDGILTRSKHDSGFSGEYDESDWIIQNESQEKTEDHVLKDFESDILNNNHDDEIFDGHTADVESEDEHDDELDELKSDEEDELHKEMARIRLSSLPAPTPENLAEDRFESSVEYLLSNSSDSDTSSKRSTRSTRSSTKGSTSDAKGRMSSQENIRVTPKKRTKRRYSRQHSNARKSLFNSNVSLPEFNTTDNYPENVTPTSRPLRRSKSFYDYNKSSQKRRQSEMFHKQSSYNSDCKSPNYGSQDFQRSTNRRLRSTTSTSTMDKSPVKRKISLGEYIIVRRDSIYDIPSKTEKEFKTSL